ncbi:MAG: type ISP restriction/modification enzyme [Desulfovibrionaceae bacterium]
MPTAILSALQRFAASAADKLRANTGEPEDHLRNPLDTFFQEAGKALGIQVQVLGEVHVENMGRPDFAVRCNGALCGYVEVKQPGKGADPRRFRTRHDKAQWERFRNFPNILYTDGNEWCLFQDGGEGSLRALSGRVERDGAQAATEADAVDLEQLLRAFFSWDPIVPRNPSQLADMLAPLCRLLRDEVKDAMQDEASPLVQLAKEWRAALFAWVNDDTFADAYAQTVTFALLLARVQGSEIADVDQAVQSLAADHALLSKALQVLTISLPSGELPTSVRLLRRVLSKVSPENWRETRGRDPWLYFYEHFLAAYDPELRKDVGAYYTPVEVVQAQVRLVDRLLTDRLGKPEGFASEGVLTLDPAVGTGTYLLGIIRHVLERTEAEQGPGATPGVASALAQQLHGFEILVGPYAVAQLRLENDLSERGATLPDGGAHVYLTDTLESPNITPQFPALLYRELSQQHEKALAVKAAKPVLICIGNPPYDRHKTAQTASKKETGGWVRWGDEDENGRYVPERAILESFVAPVREAGKSIHLKNLYNFYVYFWRWALWKVFECDTSQGPGVVSFITASSYLHGPAFAGMRETLRRMCDELWIIDLGGEGRGTRRDENVFAIQTPVAIAVAVRYGTESPSTPAAVHYCRIEGGREEKYARLAAIRDFGSLTWEDCPSEWSARFVPLGQGVFYAWPLLTDLMPWQHSGVEFKRTWPISFDEATLRKRWEALLCSPSRATAFKETRDRKIDTQVRSIRNSTELPVLQSLPPETPCPTLDAYGFRSFDRQLAIADNRVGDYLRPPLWLSHSPRQIYFASLSTEPLDQGPALTISSAIPARHYFNGRGGKDILPLYRDPACEHPNLCPGLLELLGRIYGRPVTAEDMAAYLYGILAHPGYTDRFYEELTDMELRAPLTADAGLFQRVAGLGRRLLWLHSYGERLTPEGMQPGRIPPGAAKCLTAIPGTAEGYPETFDHDAATQTLRVGEGRFAPVSSAVWDFEVSGRKVLQSWLKYRMRSGAGRRSSPLDAIRPSSWSAACTTDLLQLLWVLQDTVDIYPEQAGLLDAVLAGPLLPAQALPPVPEAAREAPSGPRGRTTQRQGSLL